jgi:cellulose synthase/poly-beta-1,6-N-acetylglucosamine synthase-like glycosyltransferase
MNLYPENLNKIETSIIIPCRNEENFIENCINSLYTQSYESSKFEIIIVDGLSNDRTVNILERLKVSYKNLRVLTNEKKHTPHALNMGIKNANGKYILILGAHSEYDRDYILNCVEVMETHPEVDCSGGPITQKGKNFFGKAGAIAMSSIIGVGNVNHRQPDYEGYAEMACFPMFRKKIFEEIGLYDENLINNQDDELCFRLNKKERKVYLTRKAKSIYYVRETFKSLFKQYYNYGYWRIAVLKKHKIPISYRQQIPFLFYIFIIIFFITGLIIKNVTISFFLPISYLMILFLFAFSKIMKEKLTVIIIIPIAIMIIHFSYALGFLIGLINRKKF